jgi:hypothetical protein
MSPFYVRISDVFIRLEPAISIKTIDGIFVLGNFRRGVLPVLRGHFETERRGLAQ